MTCGELLLSSSFGYCPYCGYEPCVGDHCPQWSEGDDYDDADAWWREGYDDSACSHAPCFWCGDVTYPGDGEICDRCLYLESREDDE